MHSESTFVWQHVVQLSFSVYSCKQRKHVFRIDILFYNRRSVLLILYENAMPKF